MCNDERGRVLPTRAPTRATGARGGRWRQHTAGRHSPPVDNGLGPLMVLSHRSVRVPSNSHDSGEDESVRSGVHSTTSSSDDADCGDPPPLPLPLRLPLPPFLAADDPRLNPSRARFEPATPAPALPFPFALRTSTSCALRTRAPAAGPRLRLAPVTPAAAALPVAGLTLPLPSGDALGAAAGAGVSVTDASVPASSMA